MEGRAMKRVILTVGVLLLVVPFLVFSQAPAPTKQQCEKWVKTNEDTEKVVKSVIDEVEKAKPKGQAAKELDDAKEWLKKAQEQLKKGKDRMKQGIYDQKVLKDLGYAWQLYIKAASAAVRAKLALKK